MRRADIRVEQAGLFFERGRKIAGLADEGKRLPLSRVVAFESAEDLLAVLTRQRVLVLKTVKEKPGSIADLARKLKRDRSAVARDVQILEHYGIVKVTEKPLPGHGRQKWVGPLASEIRLMAHL